MKTILYITAHSKPQDKSTSKTVGRAFVNEFIENHADFTVKELELSRMQIPELKCEFFKERSTLLDNEVYESLSFEDKESINRIKELAQEFKNADYYVFAVPMWNLMFPSSLKEYLDCIIQNDISVKISPDKIAGLLNDKERKMVYIQSSGGPIPWIIEGKINHGGTLIKTLFKFLGISEFHEILVDNTGFCEESRQKAIDKGIKEAIKIAKSM